MKQCPVKAFDITLNAKITRFCVFVAKITATVDVVRGRKKPLITAYIVTCSSVSVRVCVWLVTWYLLYKNKTPI